ncbi:fibrocystin-l [Plakobranchus ocellatus]|uniref:Fibrocystin-l n=1 Tax=Plakobranchus ocellatus TaxID=259542 RepID=A0AAV3YYE0_9GAST|nr:fibrocystin-l [Plakobranchus ocellatus]
MPGLATPHPTGWAVMPQNQILRWQNKTAMSKIHPRNLGPYAELKTANRLVGFPIKLVVRLEDKDTNSIITDIGWANLTWTATASIYDVAFCQSTLGGTLTVPFDPSTGMASFLNLQLNKPGKCPIKVVIKSRPADYTVKMVVFIDLMTQQQKNFVAEETHALELKFPIAYNSERALYWTAQVRNYYGDKPNMRITSDKHRGGSFMVTLNIEATSTGYKETLTTMCEEIEKDTTFTFDNTTVTMSKYLTVDGVAYYGVRCGDIKESNKGFDIETIYIIAIAIASLPIIALLAIVLFYSRPKAQATDQSAAQEGVMQQDISTHHRGDSRFHKDFSFSSVGTWADSLQGHS